jgi:Holliday junction DNA helicase RuvA
MISRLTGKVVFKAPDHAIIDVGGVGYRVNISLGTFESLPELNESTSVNVHTYVREDQLQLFGFATADEKRLFLRLISVSGIGPKLAMSLLSGLSAPSLSRAICDGDIARLSSIPGVGRKTAERLIVELKDRVKKDMSDSSDGHVPKNAVSEDVVSALINLGYKRQIAENALKRIPVSDNMRIEDILRKTLQELNRA